MSDIVTTETVPCGAHPVASFAPADVASHAQAIRELAISNGLTPFDLDTGCADFKVTIFVRNGRFQFFAASGLRPDGSSFATFARAPDIQAKLVELLGTGCDPKDYLASL